MLAKMSQDSSIVCRFKNDDFQIQQFESRMRTYPLESQLKRESDKNMYDLVLEVTLLSRLFPNQCGWRLLVNSKSIQKLLEKHKEGDVLTPVDLLEIEKQIQKEKFKLLRPNEDVDELFNQFNEYSIPLLVNQGAFKVGKSHVENKIFPHNGINTNFDVDTIGLSISFPKEFPEPFSNLSTPIIDTAGIDTPIDRKCFSKMN